MGAPLFAHVRAHRSVYVVATALSLFAVLLQGPPPAAALVSKAPYSSPAQADGCGYAPAPGIEAEVLDEGFTESQRWFGSPETRDDMEAISKLGDSAKEAIGVYLDEAASTAVLVADPGTPGSVAALEMQASLVAPGFPVRVESGCNSKAALEDTFSHLTVQRSEMSAGASYVTFIDAQQSRVAVYVESPELAAELERTYGDLVAVSIVSGLSRSAGARTNDSSPHFADSQVDANCSMGFTYTNSLAARVMVTAGHCGANGHAYFSGGNYVGSASNVFVGAADIGMVWASGQTYTNVIYTDPGAPTTRSVIGKVNPVVGTLLSANGSFSLSQCGVDVYNSNAQFCDELGCTTGMWARRDAASGPICQGGDSGGTLYQRSGSSNALAAGLITATLTDPVTHAPAPIYGYYVCFFQSVAAIEWVYGLAVTTTP